MYLLKPNFPPGIIFGFLYLHSTMYLLKHIPAVIISREWFNLHSTMYLLKRKWQITINNPVEKFTFHYVSIKTFFP